MGWFIPFLAQTAANVGAHFLQRGQGRRQFRHSRQMSELAYRRDLDMWNRQAEHQMDMWRLQNEYNLPANRMQRLRDAGLNPNLAASQGSAGGIAGSIGAPEMPRYQPARPDYRKTPFVVPNILGQYQTFKTQAAQQDLIAKQARVADEKALTEMAIRASKVKGSVAKADRDLTLARYQDAMSEQELKSAQQRLENLRLDQMFKEQQVPKTKADREIRELELKMFRDMGVRPQDPLYLRFLMSMMNGVSDFLPHNFWKGNWWKSSRIFGDVQK